MELQEYDTMRSLEESHWRYRSLRELLLAYAAKCVKAGYKLKILDVGCGTGYNLKCLSRYGAAFGMDVSRVASGYCLARGLNRIATASVSSIPFKKESFDLVIAIDLLYHKAVEDDAAAIQEMRRVLKKGGTLIVNVPAYDWLRTPHDIRVHTRHRYTKGELCKKIGASDFDIKKITYRNAFLFPAFLLLSLFKGAGNPEMSYLKKENNIIDRILYIMGRTENGLIGFMNIPFGTSVFCVAQK